MDLIDKTEEKKCTHAHNNNNQPNRMNQREKI